MPNPPQPQPPKSKGLGSEIAGVKTKWWLLGGGVAVGVVWYAYHRSSSAAAATQTPSDTGTIDPNATDPYAYDAYGGSYSAAADNSAIDPYGGSLSPVSPPASINPTTGNLLVPSTTSAWVTEAEAALLSMGYAPDAVSSALSAYSAGAPLTPAQAGAVASAGGAVGSPPGTVTTSVPPPSTAPVVHHITVHSHLVGTKVPGTNRAKLAWTPVPYADGYYLWRDGNKVASFPKTTLTFTTALQTKGRHTWWIDAYNTGGSHLGSNQIAITF